jgi:hypothetical protein
MALGYSVIVLLCVLGACGLLMGAYAIHRLYGDFYEEYSHSRSDEQESYMRRVRQRTMARLQHSAAEGYA